jgi:hypothetical protein
MRPRPSKHEVFTTCDFEGRSRVGLLVEGSHKDQRDMARKEKVRGLRDQKGHTHVTSYSIDPAHANRISPVRSPTVG